MYAVNIARFLLPVVLLFGSPIQAAEQRVAGSPAAIDGDSLDFEGVEIRLSGIDAPEFKQECVRDTTPWRCGEEAHALLASLIAGYRIECLASETDQHGRLVATCNREGLDLGLVMIEAGLAVTRSDSPPAYLAAEALRQQHKIGLWASGFQPPAEWRSANPDEVTKPLQVQAQSRAEDRAQGPSPRQAEFENRVYRGPLGCAIKGNRSRRGDWIYHLPGQKYYLQTKAEAVFCTEAEASRAGYRRSKA